jgi:3-oxoacyl-[acyl-carrier-protein] synthase II
MEAVASLLALRHEAVPPTANFQRASDDIALDIVADRPRALSPAPVLSNSFGFGGHNATLILAPAS